jgi:hypothetical protein
MVFQGENLVSELNAKKITLPIFVVFAIFEFSVMLGRIAKKSWQNEYCRAETSAVLNGQSENDRKGLKFFYFPL